MTDRQAMIPEIERRPGSVAECSAVIRFWQVGARSVILIDSAEGPAIGSGRGLRPHGGVRLIPSRLATFRAANPHRESGGIGRRTSLRSWRGNPWGFESPLSHHGVRDDFLKSVRRGIN